MDRHSTLRRNVSHFIAHEKGPGRKSDRGLGILDQDIVSGRGWPNEVWTQSFMDGTAIIRSRYAGCRVKESMIAGGQVVRRIPHQVGHNGANAALLVIQHDRGATGSTCAQFQWAVWIAGIERLPFQVIRVIDNNIAVIEKHNVGRVLTCDALANRTMAGVIVNRVVVRIGMDVLASTGIFVGHARLQCGVLGSGSVLQAQPYGY